MKDLKAWIGIILFFAGLIGCFACAIASGVIAWQNPDMTQMRRFLEYPELTVWSVVNVLAVLIGERLVKD